MKVTLRALAQKVTLVSAAFVLAVSTLTASMPFILSERVSAVAPIGNSATGTVNITASYAALFADGFDVGITVNNMVSDPAIDKLSFKFYDAADNYLTSVTAKQRLFNLENQPGTADDGTYGVRKADGSWDVSRHIFMNNPTKMVTNGWWTLDTFYEWTPATEPARVDIDFATGNGTFTRTISPLSVSSGGTYANVVTNNAYPAVKPAPVITGQYLTLFNGFIDAGFSVSMVERNATEAKVDIYKGTELLTTLKFTPAQLDRIENGRIYHTSRALYIPGPQGDTALWDLDNTFTWTADTEPTKAVFTVTGANGTTTAEANFNVQEAQSWNYQNIIASLPALTNVDAYYTVGTGYTAISTDFTVKNVTNANSVELRVHRDDSTTYSITAEQSVLDSINAGGTVTLTGPIVVAGSRTSGSWKNQVGTWTGSALPVSVEVIVTRASGAPLTLTDTLIGSSKATWAQVKPVDNEKPSVAVAMSDTVINAADVLASANPTVTVTATDAQSGVDYVQYKIMDAADNTVRGWYTVPNGVAVSTVNVVGLADGTYTLRARAFDHDGNKSSGNDVAFVVDKTAPMVKSLQIMQGTNDISGGVTNNTLITVQWGSDDTDVDYFMYKNKAGWHNIGLGTSFTGNMSGADGVFTYEVYVVDKAGNASATQTVSVTLDRVAPAAPVMRALSNGTSLNSGDTINQSDIRAEWDAVADATLYQYRYWNSISGDAHEGELKAWNKPASSALFHAGTFTQGEGTHFLQVRAGDAAGNWSGWSNAFEVTFDNTAPVVTIDPTTATTSSPTLTGTVDDNTATVTVTVDGVDYDATVTGTTWSVTLPAHADGDYAVEVTALDTAGNTSVPATATLSIVTVVADPDTTDEDEADTTTATIVLPPAINPAGEPAVQGDSTQNTGTPGVEGTATENVAQAVDSEANQGTLWGLAWYWWLLILAGVATVFWWVIAALRRRQGEA